jgi:hypothetical protein
MSSNEKYLADAMEQKSALFLRDFEKEIYNQKQHWPNCVKKIYEKSGKHYYKCHTDMDFHLFRGTNCNEAWHHQLNTIYPGHCGECLGDACLDAVTGATQS